MEFLYKFVYEKSIDKGIFVKCLFYEQSFRVDLVKI